MDAQIIASSIAAFAGLVASVISLINRNAIQEVHMTMNSRLDQLLRASIAQAHSEGRAEGVAATVIDPSVTAEAAAKVLAVAADAAKPVVKE